MDLSALENVPGMPPPPGKTPNFADPDVDGTTRPAVLAIGILFAVLTITCCALKIWIRFRIIKSPGWDDIWIIIATFFACVYTGLVLSSAALVADVHIWNVSLASLLYYLPLLRAVGYVYFVPTLLTAKIALASFLLRVFGAKTILRVSIWCSIVWSAFVSFFALFWSISRCAPIGLAYATCSAKSSLPYTVAAGMNIASDLALLVIPLGGIISLQMQTQRKFALSLVFLTGLAAVLASCLGLYYRVVQASSPDVTWNFAAVNILSMFEVHTTVIVACLPSLPAFFKQHRDFFDKVNNSIRSIKQALLVTNRSVAESTSSRSGRKNSSDRMQSTKSGKFEQSIMVQSEVHQMEEARQSSDYLAIVAPFAS